MHVASPLLRVGKQIKVSELKYQMSEGQFIDLKRHTHTHTQSIQAEQVSNICECKHFHGWHIVFGERETNVGQLVCCTVFYLRITLDS